MSFLPCAHTPHKSAKHWFRTLAKKVFTKALLQARNRFIAGRIRILVLSTILLSANALCGEGIDAGGDHVVALKSDGTLWSVGSNGYGQLGDGTTASRSSFAQVAGLINVVEASAGANHTVVLKSDGTVWTFGYNTSGQLGDGTTQNRSLPTQVSGLDDNIPVISVSAGGAHTVVLKSDGSVWVFGSNTSGQLGDGTSISKNSPIKISNLSNIVAISAGENHTAVLKSDGTVWTFGDNTEGKLGDGTSINRSSPVHVVGLNDVVALSAGYDHTLALKSDGTVWGFGSNKVGELGDGTTSSRKTPIQISTLSDIVSVSAGHGHSVVLKTDGTVLTFGSNSYGQLGDGTWVNRYYPVQPIKSDGIKFVSAGRRVIVVSDESGRMFGYGISINGTAGDINVAAYRYKAIEASTGEKFSNVTAGSSHVLGLKSDGTVCAWGSNQYGQLGDGSYLDHSTPLEIEGLNDVAAVSAGSAHSITLKNDGTVWTFGLNSSGQLGDGTWVSKSIPVQVSGLNHVVAVSAGGSHSVALKDDGTVWTWGGNESGQLGDGTNVDRNAPVQVVGLTGVSSLAAGGGHTVALSDNGSLWAFGFNSYGQLGDGTLVDRNYPVEVTGLSGIAKIAAGGQHTIALKSGGTLWGTGSNSQQQIRAGAAFRSTVFIPINGYENVIDVDAGNEHTVVLLSNKKADSFGFPQPTRVNPVIPPLELDGIKTIKAGWRFSVVIKEDGGLAGWGGTSQLVEINPTHLPKPFLSLNLLHHSPQVSIFSPTAPTTVALGSSITALASITGGNGSSGTVFFYHHDVLIGQDDAAPYELNFVPWTWGDFEITAIGEYGNGAFSKRTQPILVKVPYNFDNDDLPDWWEIRNFADLDETATGNADADGLSHLEEYQHGTNPNAKDTDGDGMDDDEEIAHGLNPLENDRFGDADGDRYPNIFEVRHHTDPQDANSVPNADFVVNTVSGGTHQDLQGAIGAVDADYQIIAVAAGTYRGVANTGLTLGAFKTLLISTDGASKTIIDGEQARVGLTLSTDTVIDGFTFRNGAAENGGALTTESGEVRVVNCVFLDNSAIDYGGAIFNEGASLLVVHSTFLNNTAESGNALYNDSGTSSIVNSILWGESGLEVGYESSTSVTAIYSDIRGGFPGEGNLNVDPLLTTGGHLTHLSPARDAADLVDAANVDMDGEVRPTGTSSDIGADEWLDSEPDFLPDWWELLHFGDLTQVASGNPDQDLVPNVDEYAQGTDPDEEAPQAVALSLTTQEDTSFVLPFSTTAQYSGVQPEYEIVVFPEKGDIVEEDGIWRYYPRAHEYGTDNFTYLAKRGSLESVAVSVTIVITPVNDPPLVYAGPNVTANTGVPLVLQGAVEDVDTLPGDMTTTWRVEQKPAGASVEFSSPASLTSNATFTKAGEYLLRLTAFDGSTRSDLVLVQVEDIMTPSPIQVTWVAPTQAVSTVASGSSVLFEATVNFGVETIGNVQLLRGAVVHATMNPIAGQPGSFRYQLPSLAFGMYEFTVRARSTTGAVALSSVRRVSGTFGDYVITGPGNQNWSTSGGNGGVVIGSTNTNGNGSYNPNLPPGPGNLSPNTTGSDEDADGLSAAEEAELGTDPSNADSDGDGALDGDDAVPYDRAFNHAPTPESQYAVIELAQYPQSHHLFIDGVLSGPEGHYIWEVIQGEFYDERTDDFYYWSPSTGEVDHIPFQEMIPGGGVDLNGAPLAGAVSGITSSGALVGYGYQQRDEYGGDTLPFIREPEGSSVWLPNMVTNGSLALIQSGEIVIPGTLDPQDYGGAGLASHLAYVGINERPLLQANIDMVVPGEPGDEGYPLRTFGVIHEVVNNVLQEVTDIEAGIFGEVMASSQNGYLYRRYTASESSIILKHKHGTQTIPIIESSFGSATMSAGNPGRELLKRDWPWVVSNESRWIEPQPGPAKLWTPDETGTYRSHYIYRSPQAHGERDPIREIRYINSLGQALVDNGALWSNGRTRYIKDLLGAENAARYTEWQFHGLAENGVISAQAKRNGMHCMLSLVPVQLDYITRDPETGFFQNLGGVVDESDPRPSLKLTDIQASILSGGQLQITVKGETRDQLSELLDNNAGEPSSIELFVNGESVTTISNLDNGDSGIPPLVPWQRRDSTKTFIKTVTLPSLFSGVHTIVAKTNPNALNQRGWASAAVLVEKIQYGDLPASGVPSLTYTLSQNLTPATQDSIVVNLNGSQSVTLTESNGQQGTFTGNAVIGGSNRQVRVQLPKTFALNSSTTETLGAKFGYQDSSGRAINIEGAYTETAIETGSFVCANPLSTVDSYENLRIAGEVLSVAQQSRAFQPSVIRVALPESIATQAVNDGWLKFELNGAEVELIESTSTLPDHQPPVGTKYFYVAAGGEPAVYLAHKNIPEEHYPSQVAQDGEFRLVVKQDGQNAVLFEGKAAISQLAPFNETPSPNLLNSPPPPSGVAPLSSPENEGSNEYAIEDIKLLFELIFGKAGLDILEMYEDAGVAVEITSWIGFSTYDFDGIRPWEADGSSSAQETAKILINRDRCDTVVDAATALFNALQDLNSKSAILLRTSLDPHGLAFDEILDNVESEGQDLVRAWRTRTLAPLEETIVGFTETVRFGLGFTLVGDAIVTAADASQAIHDNDTVSAVIVIGMVLTPEVIERMWAWCKRTGKPWRCKFGGNVDVEFDATKLGALLTLSKDATVSQKLDALRPLIDDGTITPDILESLWAGGYLRSKYPRAELAANLGNSWIMKLTHSPQHDLPVAKEIEFIKRGLDINTASNGRWLPREFHKIIHGKGTSGQGWGPGGPWNYQWESFFTLKPDATRQDVELFLTKLRSLTSDFSKTADQIDWPHKPQ